MLLKTLLGSQIYLFWFAGKVLTLCVLLKRGDHVQDVCLKAIYATSDKSIGARFVRVKQIDIG